MRSYWKIRSAYDGRIDEAKLYGDQPKYFWTHQEAQRRCDDLNLMNCKDLMLSGVFNVLERVENNGKFDDNEAGAVLAEG